MNPKNKKSLFLASICTISALTLIGSLVFIKALTGKPISNETTLNVNNITSKTLRVSIEELAPGFEEDYVINLSGKELDTLSISLSFVNKDEKGKLSDYLTVSISGGDYKDSMPLKTAFSLNEPISLGKGVSKISLSYLLSDQIGNEAQNTYADFNVKIKAER